MLMVFATYNVIFIDGFFVMKRVLEIMKLHCDRTFAGKKITNRATSGNLPVRRGGAFTVFQGHFAHECWKRCGEAALMFRVPLRWPLCSAVCSPPSLASIVVEATGASRSRPSARISSRDPRRLDQAQIDDDKALIETGLFNCTGGRLVVVVENPVIGRIAFEGNKKVKDEQLSAEIQSKPRGTFSRPMVQSDAQRIAEIYRRSGRYDVRVTPEIIEQPNNRVDLIFTVTEGSKTGVKSIEFIGNVAYSTYRLKDVIKTRESNLLSFLGGADVYDPDRVEPTAT
jgi:outer membrane protein insertion porin family